MEKIGPSDGSISILPDFIANQIAAGEVVQRPESVVKELVENSLDSGADAIAVIVRGAGKNLVHVVDNGSGMSAKDLELATKRHATSKIRTAEDLENILTYGFRGEALASISSVAHLEIRTKRPQDKIGWILTSEPMKSHRVEPGGVDNGTQAFVKNLFFNVPARRKFLRSNLTEFRYVSDTMLKFAISRPDKRFTFYDGDNIIFDFAPAALDLRIADALGKNIAGALLEMKYDAGPLQISGFLVEPQLARQARSGQFLFLNGRSVKSPSLCHAVYASLEGLLEKNKHPVFIINIDIDPQRVDVNVHPQKNEVKFDDQRFVYNSLLKAAGAALKTNSLIPEILLKEQAARSPFESVFIPGVDRNSDRVVINTETGEILDGDSEKNRTAPNSSFMKGRETGRGPGTSQYPPNNFDRRRVESEEISAFEELFEKEKPARGSKEVFDLPDDDSAGLAAAGGWQLHNKYIIFPARAGMAVLNRRRGHIRVVYERILKSMDKGAANSQDLLFPVLMNFDPAQNALIKELDADIRSVGFSFNILEDGVVELKAVPADIITGGEEKSFIEMIETFEGDAEGVGGGRREKIAASCAASAAVRDGDPLSPDEARSLVRELFMCKSPMTSPFGGRTFLMLSISQIDDMFMRPY